MKKVILSLMLVLALSSMLICQSVQDVPATDAQGNPIYNSLIKYVVADTNAQGQQLHDIYKLERGKYYYYNQSAVFNNPITLEADAPGTDSTTFPPRFLIVPDSAGTINSIDIIDTYANLTCKNIWFSTISTDNQFSQGTGISLEKDGLRIELDSCIFSLCGYEFIYAEGVNHTKLIVRGCETENGTMIGGDEWCPFFFSAQGGSVDTCIMTNNTFFNIQGSVLNIDPLTPWKYIFFDHNTCVNIVQNFTTDIGGHLNSTITNNIFYNVGDYGYKPSDIAGTHYEPGIIEADTLAPNTIEGDSLPPVMAEKDRILKVENNVYFWSSGVESYYKAMEADSIIRITWMNQYAASMFANKTAWPNFIAQNNVQADPGFKNFGGTDAMITQMYNDRSTGTFGFWGWYPYPVTNGDTLWALSHWPLPQNFSYSGSFTSTDGFHVGSLQWYPSELAQYNEGVTDVKQSHNIVPKQFSLQQNYPNPFNPSTMVNFTLPQSGIVELSIYNVLGQKVRDIINNQNMSSGFHQVNINMLKQASGIYLLVLRQNNLVKTIKMVLMK